MKSPARVVLTGSTGNLGSYLLNSLLADPGVSSITCLNRTRDAETRQREAHLTRGLTVNFDRVSFLCVNVADPKLGLSEDAYNTLAASCDMLIHNAWPVDFNRHFSSFRESLLGVSRLIQLCLASSTETSSGSNPVAPRQFVFISSVGATSNWNSAAPTSRATIPELEITDWKVARTGYGQSKLVAERLLTHAAAVSNLPVAILRVGQIGGPVLHGLSGRWPEHEWLPSLIRSSMLLRALPRTLGPTEVVDWVPVDLAARIIVEISMNQSAIAPVAPTKREKRKAAGTCRFYHVVNPHPVDWERLTPVILEELGPTVELVSFVEWVRRLKQSAKDLPGIDNNPAAKLLDYFDNLQDRAFRFPEARLALLDCKEAQLASQTMSSLQAITPEWMGLWLRQWDWRTKEGVIDA